MSSIIINSYLQLDENGGGVGFGSGVFFIGASENVVALTATVTGQEYMIGSIPVQINEGV